MPVVVFSSFSRAAADKLIAIGWDKAASEPFGYCLSRQSMRHILLLFWLLPVLLPAQQVSVGFRGGVAYTTAAVDPELSLAARTGVMLAAGAEFQFTEWFGLQGEVQFVQRGARIALPTGIGRVAGTYELDYVQFPLLLKTGITEGRLRAFAMAGPTLGLLFSAQARGSVAGIDTTLSATDDFTNSEWALEFGGGTEIAIDPMLTLTADVRYAVGLTNVLRQSDFPPLQINEMKLNGLKAGIGVIFRL